MISEQTKSADLLKAAKFCDSYGEVEQVDAPTPQGRFGVMCFFDSAEDATDFRQAIAVAGC